MILFGGINFIKMITYPLNKQTNFPLSVRSKSTKDCKELATIETLKE